MLVELIRRFWPTATQEQMLFAAFGIYVVLLVAFGIVYYRLYRGRADRFFFASEIVASQAKTVMAKTKRLMSTLMTEIDAMDEVHKALLSGTIAGSPATLPSGHTVQAHTYTMHSGSGDSQDRLCLTVTDQDGVVLCGVEGPQDDSLTTEYFLRWLGEMLRVWRAKLEYQQKHLAEVSQDPTKSWSLLDFLYFSGTTQTTLGYGDMLPNCRTIRLLVIVQVICGIGLLALIFNVILIR